MTNQFNLAFWKRASVLAAAASLLFGAVQPAQADYTRSCRAWLEVRPAGESTAIESYEWRVYNTVTLFAQVNEARREARRAIVTCMRTHWDERDGDSAPYACQSHGSLEVRGYPFADLTDQLRDDLCGATGETRLDLDLVLFIDGETGCVVDGGHLNPATRVDITEGFRINCPIPEGGGWDCVGEGCDGEEAEDEGEGIPEGGDWECVGEGCDGDDAEDAGGVPDPTALYRIFSNIRLPGRDIGLVDVADGDWPACAAACAANDACHAWTYRNMYRGVSSVCLLKSGAGVPIPDPCCRSGVER